MSKNKLSFKEYYDSKQKLKMAGDNYPRYYTLYEVNKYCKIPLSKDCDEDEREYIPLKPKDKIKVLWEMLDMDKPVPKYIAVVDEELEEEKKYRFTWNLTKINKWLSSTTHKKR